MRVLDPFNSQEVRRQWHVAWPDLLIGALLSIGVGYVVWRLSWTTPAVLFDGTQSGKLVNDVWFEADLARVYANMTTRWSDHYRSAVHPFFSMFALVPVTLLKWLGMSPMTAAFTLMSSVAGAVVAVTYGLLRALSLDRLSSLSFTLLLASSAAFVFFAAVPETYSSGALSILVAGGLLMCADRAQSERATDRWTAMAIVAAMSITTTNVMLALIGLASIRGLRRHWHIGTTALTLALILAALQKLLVPSAGFFLNVAAERSYLVHPTWISLGDRLVGLTIRPLTITSSLLETAFQGDAPPQFLISNAPAWGTAVQGTVVMAWGVLVFWGAVVAWRRRTISPIPLYFVAFAVAQLALHSVYGEEPFLYSLHLMTALVMVAAQAAHGRRGRVVATIIAAAITVFSVTTNFQLRESLVSRVQAVIDVRGDGRTQWPADVLGRRTENLTQSSF